MVNRWRWECHARRQRCPRRVLHLRLDVLDHDRLRRRQDEVDGVRVDEFTQRRFQPELGRVPDASLLDVDPEHPLAVALLVPPHPVEVLPRRQRRPRQDLLSVVLLRQRAEVVDAECVHKVLEAGVRPHLAVAVVALQGRRGAG